MPQVPSNYTATFTDNHNNNCMTDRAMCVWFCLEQWQGVIVGGGGRRLGGEGGGREERRVVVVEEDKDMK